MTRTTTTPAPAAAPRRREPAPLRLVDYLRESFGLRAPQGPEAPRPRTLTHTVTFRCNARCVMCDSWRLPRQDELSLADVDRIYAQLPPLDVVRLTGGEPFVRKDLGDIEALAVHRLAPRLVHVTTNGFLTERIVRFVEERDALTPLHVLVSIDGVEGKHDEIRGVPRSFERAYQTLEELARRRRSHNLRIAVNQTVLDGEGARHYAALRDRIAALGVRVHVVVAHRESATYALERDLERQVDGEDAYETHGRFSLAEIRGLLDEAEADLVLLDRGERMAKAYYLAGLRRRLLGEQGPAAPSCVALHAHLRLFPNGDVPTCQQNSRVVGNLREQPFDEVWRGAAAREQRAWVKACAGCWAECEVLPSAAYTGELLRHSLRRPTHWIPPARRRVASRRSPRAPVGIVTRRGDAATSP